MSCVTLSTSFDVSVPEVLVSGVGNCGNGGGGSEGSGVTVKDAWSEHICSSGDGGACVCLTAKRSRSSFSLEKISLTFRSRATRKRRRPGFPLRRVPNSPGVSSTVP